jgi:dynein heavy chain
VLPLQVLDRSQQIPNPSAAWISEEAWDNLTTLDALPSFKGLASSLESSNGDWELWFRQQEPETAELPREWESKCNELQRMLLVRSMRPDRVIFAATKYVANALGKKFVEPPVLDLGETYADSTALSPLIFVLSAGVDPTAQLRKLAAEKSMSSKLHAVALGQGQVSAASPSAGKFAGPGYFKWGAGHMHVDINVIYLPHRVKATSSLSEAPPRPTAQLARCLTEDQSIAVLVTLHTSSTHVLFIHAPP